MELLVVISLMGLIFGIGIYPVMSQLRLLRAHRAEIALFDDANLAVFHITKDARRAELRDEYRGGDSINEVTFGINANALDPITYSDPNARTLHFVRYYIDSVNTNELRREHLDEGRNLINDILITDKLDQTPLAPGPLVFGPVFDPYELQLHRLECHIQLRDRRNPNIITERVFDVMLRCRDRVYQ